MSLNKTPMNDSLGQPPLFETITLAGLPIAVSSPQDAAERICQVSENIRDERGLGIHLVNAYTIALAEGDKNYALVLSHAAANLPDGKPLTWIGALKRKRLSQVRGPSLFENVVAIGRETSLKHFLLGSTDDTLQKLKSQLERRYPGISIVGQLSPPYRQMTPTETAAQDQVISESGANIVWVGLGTPKQDFEVERLSQALPVVAIAIGAAFDFVAGTKREAPSWMSKVGLEWLFRLASEPRRLWRRYLFGNIRFLWAMLKGDTRP